MDIVMQVLGAAGLVETVVEFTYVLTNRHNFTPFEEVFFLASGCTEMLAEVVFLLMVVRITFRDRNFKVVKSVVRDPIHNLAKRAFDLTAGKELEEIAGDYVDGAILTLLVAALPLPVWATFWPVWGELFDGDGDDGLRLALSSCSLGLYCVWIYFSCREKTLTGTASCLVFVVYAMEKAFEVCVLLSDVERLCAGGLGKALLALLLVEISSLAFILARFAWFLLTFR